MKLYSGGLNFVTESPVDNPVATAPPSLPTSASYESKVGEEDSAEELKSEEGKVGEEGGFVPSKDESPFVRSSSYSEVRVISQLFAVNWSFNVRCVFHKVA